MKPITTYIELSNKRAELQKAIIKTPFFAEVVIDDTGSLCIGNDCWLTPEEALRLGTWLVAFYKGAK